MNDNSVLIFKVQVADTLIDSMRYCSNKHIFLFDCLVTIFFSILRKSASPLVTVFQHQYQKKDIQRNPDAVSTNNYYVSLHYSIQYP